MINSLNLVEKNVKHGEGEMPQPVRVHSAPWRTYVGFSAATAGVSHQPTIPEEPIPSSNFLWHMYAHTHTHNNNFF